jgi:CelD/BcsL family acetyltransferase involved in cellulose biosynthesis
VDHAQLLTAPKRLDREAREVGVLRITVHESLASAETVRPEWDALLAEYPYSTPFSTWEWLSSWWRAFGENDRLMVLAVRDASSALIGLAPLALTVRQVCGVTLRSLRMMGDGSYDSDNLDLPVRPGREAEFSCALLDWLERHARDWDVCQLRTLPANSPIGNRLPADLSGRGWKAYTSRQPQSVVDLPGSWDAYLKKLSSKERGKIGLRARRLEKKYSVRTRKCAETSELESALEALFDLHTRHWRLRGSRGSFQWDARRQFYRALTPLLLARRMLEFWLLELDGRIAAAQFALLYGESAYALQEGFDPEYSTDSIGYVLRAHVLKDLIGRGIRRYDFMFGVDESKLRWGARVQNYLSVGFARPRTIGVPLLSAKRRIAGTTAWLRARVPDPALRLWERLRAR